MSVKSYWYTNFYKQIYAASPAYGGWKASGGDSFKVALCGPAYTPNQDTHAVLNDIIQVSGQGYTAGGQVLTGKTISVATGSLVLSANPATWAGCVFTVRYAVIYDDTNASPLSKQLVRWIDFGQNIILTAQTLTLTFDGQGSIDVTPPPGDTTPPNLADATVDKAVMTLTFDEQLKTTVTPATTAFAVTVDVASRSVSTVVVSGTTVVLTLSSAVTQNQVVTVAYTQPVTNPLQDLAGNKVVTFAAISVLNQTIDVPPPDVTPPSLVQANINGAGLALTYTETLNPASVPATSAFTVKTDGNTRALSSVSISNTQVLITLAVPVVSTNVVTVSYTAGGSPIEDLVGNNAANLVNQAVTNLTPVETVPPTITAITVDTASLVITYSEPLDTTSTPVTGSYTVTVNAASRGVNTVVVAGSAVTLTLASAVLSTDSVVASYVRPTTNPVQDLASNDAASFFNVPVTNITTPSAPTDIASFVSQSIPSTAMTTNATQTVGVTMRNDGTATWSAASGYQLYSQNPAGNTNWGLSQVPVPGNVLANGSAAFSFLITAPAAAGTYNFQWRMRHNTTEFGAQSTNQAIVVSTPTQFGTFFVSATGSDTNAGTQLAPFRTLAKAFSVVQPSGSVQIRGGTYLEGVVNNCPGGTSWTNSITVQAYQNEPVILRPSTGANFVIWLQGAIRKYIQFRDLVLDGVNVGFNVVKLDRPSAGTDSANHIRLYNCELKNSKFQAMLVVFASDSNEFQKLSIHNCGKTIDSDGLYGYAMYIKGSSNLIEDCDIYDQGSSGIQIFSTTGTSEPPNFNTIRRCKIHNNCVLSAAQGRGAGITIASGSQNLVYNNLIYVNFRGISCSNTFTNKMYNNTIASNPDIGLFLENGGSHSCRNNVCYLNGTNFLNTSSGGTVTPNITTQNPNFVSGPTSSYYLGNPSPAANSGATLTEFSDDYDLNPRPFGTAWDQGAYERQS